MTAALGAGDARYRLGGGAGPADTVFLGVFRREALEAAGGFDETLLRNEDYELNWRLRERGETVWLEPALAVAYRPRESFAALAAQYFAYGWWKRVVLRRHPRSVRWRQLAAPALVLGLAASAAVAMAGAVHAASATLAAAGAVHAASAALAAAGAVHAASAALAAAGVVHAAALLPAAYAAVLLGGAAGAAVRRRDPAALLLPPVLATMHLAWGTGFWCAWALRRR